MEPEKTSTWPSLFQADPNHLHTYYILSHRHGVRQLAWACRSTLQQFFLLDAFISVADDKQHCSRVQEKRLDSWKTSERDRGCTRTRCCKKVRSKTPRAVVICPISGVDEVTRCCLLLESELKSNHLHAPAARCYEPLVFRATICPPTVIAWDKARKLGTIGVGRT